MHSPASMTFTFNFSVNDLCGELFKSESQSLQNWAIFVTRSILVTSKQRLSTVFHSHNGMTLYYAINKCFYSLLRSILLRLSCIRTPAASCPLNRRPADWIGLVFRANEIFAIWIISGFQRYDRMAHSKDTRTPVIGT